MSPEISPAAYEILPKHLREGMRRYIKHGIATGSFLRAALENDFTMVFATGADDLDLVEFRHVANFLRFRAPHDAWGSPAKVQAWIDAHKEERSPI